MGYDTDKFNLESQSIAGNRRFSYVDTGGETAAAFQGSGFFADAKAKGARVGDRVEIADLTADDVLTGVFLEVQDTGGTSGTVKLDTGQ